MSASRERKKRTEQVGVPVVKKVKAKKLSEGWIFAIVMVAVVAVLIAGLVGWGIYKRNRTVMKVGDHKVSVKEFNYYYSSAANNISNYASYVGIESGIALDQQYVTESGSGMMGLFGLDAAVLDGHTAVDGTYDITWAQVIAASAKKNIASTYAVYNEAMANGFEITEHMEEEVDEAVEQIEEYAKNSDMSTGAFIERVYGKGCSVSGYRDFLMVQTVASHYPATLEYSQEEIDAKKAEAPEDYTVASYYQYAISAGDFVEADEEGNKPDPTDAEKKEAKEAAEAMAKEFNADDEKVSIKVDTARSTATSSATEDAANWLFDEAEKDDVKLFKNEDGDTYYVLKLVDKTDYLAGNFLQLYIPADGEEIAEGELTAAEKQEKVLAALEKDASADNFKALAAEYSAAEEAEVEKCLRSSLNSISEEALFWSMEERAAGDYEVFDSNGSTIILFYTGASEMHYSDVVVSQVLANDHITEIGEAAEAACEYDEKIAMTGNVGLAFNAG